MIDIEELVILEEFEERKR